MNHVLKTLMSMTSPIGAGFDRPSPSEYQVQPAISPRNGLFCESSMSPLPRHDRIDTRYVWPFPTPVSVAASATPVETTSWMFNTYVLPPPAYAKTHPAPRRLSKRRLSI